MRTLSIVLTLGLVAAAGCKAEPPAWPPADHRVAKFGEAEQAAHRGRLAKAKLKVKATHYELEPRLIRVRPRQPVNLVVKNETNREHHVALSLINGGLSADDWIEARDTASITFTAPAKPGTYPLRCPDGARAIECSLEAKLVVIPTPET